MTKSQIFKKIILELWYFILAYITNYVLPKIKESFIYGKEQFINYLWQNIKEDLKFHINNVLQDVENLFKSASFEIKEKIIIDLLFKRIKIPCLLKIFKPLLKKVLKKKLHEFILHNFEKIHKKINTII